MLYIAIILFINDVLSCNRTLFCRNAFIFTIFDILTARAVSMTPAASIALEILIIPDITIAHAISKIVVSLDNIWCFITFLMLRIMEV